jgi:two-component system response regulator ChvI
MIGAMSAQRRLAIIEDDPVFAQILAQNLTAAGFRADWYNTPEAALVAIDELKASHLLILDWRLPGMTGVELLQRLRAMGCLTQGLLLTSHDDVFFEESALAAGAVDFIAKTRSFGVILRRIELVLSGSRIEPEAAARPFRRGSLRVEPASHRATWSGRPVGLTLGEFRVTERLARADGDVSYRQLYDVLKGESFVAGSGPEGFRANVRTLMKRIRQKFQEVDPQFDAIESVPGFGYRWMGIDSSGDQA